MIFAIVLVPAFRITELLIPLLPPPPPPRYCFIRILLAIYFFFSIEKVGGKYTLFSGFGQIALATNIVEQMMDGMVQHRIQAVSCNMRIHQY